MAIIRPLPFLHLTNNAPQLINPLSNRDPGLIIWRNIAPGRYKSSDPVTILPVIAVRGPAGVAIRPHSVYSPFVPSTTALFIPATCASTAAIRLQPARRGFLPLLALPVANLHPSISGPILLYSARRLAGLLIRTVEASFSSTTRSSLPLTSEPSSPMARICRIFA